MATYTPPYPPKVKESINVDFKDRWTAQKVKFINRENEFYGTFYGVLNLSTTNVSGFIIDDSEFNNGRINSSTLSGSYVLTENGEKISFDDIISSQNKLSNDINELDKKININDSRIDELSGHVLINSASIDDLYKKITGGLNFKGVLSIDHSYDTVKQFLGEKLEDYSLTVNSGWYYLIETNPIDAHFTVEGLDISYRDCLVIKNTKQIKNITSSDVVIYDMMDKDVVRLSSDNVIFGKNRFTNDIYAGFSKIYDTDPTYLTDLFDKLDDNPFVLEIANRTVDILNVTGLSNDVHFNISSDNIK